MNERKELQILYREFREIMQRSIDGPSFDYDDSARRRVGEAISRSAPKTQLYFTKRFAAR